MPQNVEAFPRGASCQEEKVSLQEKRGSDPAPKYKVPLITDLCKHISMQIVRMACTFSHVLCFATGITHFAGAAELPLATVKIR